MTREYLTCQIPPGRFPIPAGKSPSANPLVHIEETTFLHEVGCHPDDWRLYHTPRYTLLSGALNGAPKDSLLFAAGVGIHLLVLNYLGVSRGIFVLYLLLFPIGWGTLVTGLLALRAALGRWRRVIVLVEHAPDAETAKAMALWDRVSSARARAMLSGNIPKSVAVIDGSKADTNTVSGCEEDWVEVPIPTGREDVIVMALIDSGMDFTPRGSVICVPRTSLVAAQAIIATAV